MAIFLLPELIKALVARIPPSKLSELTTVVSGVNKRSKATIGASIAI